MKARILILLSEVACMLSCSDSSAVRDAKGAYRYKTTGKVTLEENYAGATKGDTLVANLENESGTLEVVSLHKGDSVLITIDQMNGDVTVTRGKTNGDRLDFASFTRTLEVPTTVKYFDTIQVSVGPVTLVDSVIVRERKELEVYDITVQGHADVYENNLVFDLQYTGKSQSTERTLRGKDIRCLAKKN